jgi:hypothetical protein
MLQKLHLIPNHSSDIDLLILVKIGVSRMAFRGIRGFPSCKPSFHKGISLEHRDITISLR